MDLIVLVSHWEQQEEPDLSGVWAFLPKERAERLKRTAKKQQLPILAAYGLLRQGVKQLLQREELPELSKVGQGKPCFSGFPDLQFNLSHTDGCAVCAFSDAPLGVDVERIRPVTRQRARRLRLPEDERGFFEEWTVRESIVKLRGSSALLCRAPLSLSAGEHLRLLDFGDHYAAAICSWSPRPVTIQEIEPAALL